VLFGLRLPERLLLWFSATPSWPFNIDPILGIVRAGAASEFAGALVASAVDGSCKRDSEGCGVGGLLVVVGVVLLIAGSCGPCSGMDALIGGGT
jgi:hypothetical protein